MLKKIEEQIDIKRNIVRVGGILREIVTVKDATGSILSKAMRPLMHEFYARDVLQVVIGATVLAIPVGFTEEVWNLSATLPPINIIGIAIFSIFFLILFIYYNFYRDHLTSNLWNFSKRVLLTYLITLCVVGFLLFLIEKAPFGSDPILALKRIVIVSLPASLSAAIADMLK